MTSFADLHALRADRPEASVDDDGLGMGAHTKCDKDNRTAVWDKKVCP